MYPSVAQAFRPLSGRLEGIFDTMYPDIYGLVTTGLGNLIDASANKALLPWSPALMWTWRDRLTGQPVSEAEVVREWERMKNNPDLMEAGVGRKRAAARLYLDQGEVDRLFNWRLHADEQILRRRFPGWDDEFPADAQMATLLVAWAAGAGFAWPNTVAAIQARDWAAASQHARSRKMNQNRNDAITGHFLAAQMVKTEGRPRDSLYFVLTGA